MRGSAVRGLGVFYLEEKETQEKEKMIYRAINDLRYQA